MNPAQTHYHRWWLLCAPWPADALALARAQADRAGWEQLVRDDFAPTRDGAAGNLRAMVDDSAAARLRAHAQNGKGDLLIAMPQLGAERARRFIQGVAMAHGVNLVMVIVQRTLAGTLKLPAVRGQGREVRRAHAAFEMPLDADLQIDATLPLAQQLLLFPVVGPGTDRSAV